MHNFRIIEITGDEVRVSYDKQTGVNPVSNINLNNRDETIERCTQAISAQMPLSSELIRRALEAHLPETE
jgi:hypothetical protein